MASRRGEWALFVVATLALGITNAVLRMPSTEALEAALVPRHPAEWFVFYFVPPVAWAVIALAVAAWYQAIQRRMDTRSEIRLPLRGAWIAALVISVLSLAGRAHATERSPAVRAEFRRLNPCPSTGRTTGACPGWQADHLQPLCAGGADAVDNMRWLEVDAHKEKTRRDIAACRGKVFRSR